MIFTVYILRQNTVVGMKCGLDIAKWHLWFLCYEIEMKSVAFVRQLSSTEQQAQHGGVILRSISRYLFNWSGEQYEAKLSAVVLQVTEALNIRAES